MIHHMFNQWLVEQFKYWVVTEDKVEGTKLIYPDRDGNLICFDYQTSTWLYHINYKTGLTEFRVHNHFHLCTWFEIVQSRFDRIDSPSRCRTLFKLCFINVLSCNNKFLNIPDLARYLVFSKRGTKCAMIRNMPISKIWAYMPQLWPVFQLLLKIEGKG